MMLDNYAEENETKGVFAPSRLDGFRTDRRSSQDPSYLNVVGGPTRDAAALPSGFSEADQQQIGLGGGGTPFSPYANHEHSHRPSVHASQSFPSQATNQRAYNTNSSIDDDDLHDTFTRRLTLGERPNNNGTNGFAAISAYMGSPQTFQFNPGTQSWDAGPGINPKGFTQGQQQDTYGEVAAGPYVSSKRANAADRVSTPGNSQRQLSSPKGLGTPEPWSRPTSRDLRTTQDMERRGQGQQHHASPYLGHPLYGAYCPPAYPPSFDPYTSPSFRPPMPIPGYALPMGTFIPSAAGMAVRPAKDHDLEAGMRSPLLHEFRSSSKSNKRYELKVGQALGGEAKPSLRLG